MIEMYIVNQIFQSCSHFQVIFQYVTYDFPSLHFRLLMLCKEASKSVGSAAEHVHKPYLGRDVLGNLIFSNLALLNISFLSLACLALSQGIWGPQLRGTIGLGHWTPIASVPWQLKEIIFSCDVPNFHP